MGIRVRTCSNGKCLMLISNHETVCPYCGQALTPLVETDEPTRH